jgi:hypothetical protein
MFGIGTGIQVPEGVNWLAAEFASTGGILVFIFSGKMHILRVWCRFRVGFSPLRRLFGLSFVSGLWAAGAVKRPDSKVPVENCSVEFVCFACSVLPCFRLDFSGLTQC